MKKLNVCGVEDGENMENIGAYDAAHGIKFDGYLLVTRADGSKCERCWRYYLDVNQYMWANVCKRCNDVLEVLFEQDPTRIRSL
jgi:hypothetical protein